jgi:16S rRNA pseudouridine516 synthase
MRLDKFLSNANIGSRKEVSGMIRNKRVKVDGAVISKPNHQVSYAAHVEVDGGRIHLEEYIYLMLNKPEGVISSTEEGPTPTVMDLVDHPQVNELFPVGRLDKDTTGLLLITNDGKFSHALLSPRHKVGKTYEVTLRDDVTDEDLTELEKGIPLKDFTTSPAIARRLADRKVALTIYEGKFHQVKRMFLYLGNEVTALKRTAFAGLELDESLAEGESRHLTEGEIKKLS